MVKGVINLNERLVGWVIEINRVAGCRGIVTLSHQVGLRPLKCRRHFQLFSDAHKQGAGLNRQVVHDVLA